MNDYSTSFVVPAAPQAAYDAIGRIAAWWTQDTEGSSITVGDVFTIRFGKIRKTLQVTEAVPGTRITWRVVDCHMPFLTNTTEWTGTEILFDISGTNGGTRVQLTHMGLVPGIECYGQCEQGWGFFFGESLFNLLAEGKGEPHTAKAQRARTT